MQLINTETLKLETFVSETAPAYAILSHTWGADELILQEFEQSKGREKAGFRKIQYTCDEARSHGIPYAWVDTVCIDKASSADLSEAINSMWSWYKKARVCYAYLQDVTIEDIANLKSEHSQARQESISSSEAPSLLPDTRWTRRGWTLQELLAPGEVRFFSVEWHQLGTRSSLADALSAQTRIDVEILQGHRSIYEESVAKRMSWAAGRETTRIEDQSYCLLGIFDVNMPLLYGEGEKAFIRLQEEILRNSDDESIFAWKNPHADPDSLCGLLAKSPWMFRDSAECVPYRDWARPHFPTSSSNLGTSLSVILAPSPIRSGASHDRMAHIRCRTTSGDNVAIRIREIAQGLGQYARVSTQESFASQLPSGSPQNIFVRRQPVRPETKDTFAPVKWSFDGFEAMSRPVKVYPKVVRLLTHAPMSWEQDFRKGSTKGTTVMIPGVSSRCDSVFFVEPESDASIAFFIQLGSADMVDPNATSQRPAFSVLTQKDLNLPPGFCRYDILIHVDRLFKEYTPRAYFGESLELDSLCRIHVKITMERYDTRHFTILIEPFVTGLSPARKNTARRTSRFKTSFEKIR